MVRLYILSATTLLLIFCIFILPKEALADQGTATYYTPPYTPWSCYGNTDEGVKIAAASDAIWENRAACGRKYRVTCLSGTNQGDPHPCSGKSVVKIVDYCPSPGCQGTIDLSQEAFQTIANLDAGKINIAFHLV